MQSFKEFLFSVFCLFCLSLLSNNTFHVILYTYICYWNKFQCKYIIQITFHVEKQFHARVTQKIFVYSLSYYLFACFYFVSLKITWHRGRLNKKVKIERVSNWIDVQSLYLGFTSFKVPPCLLPETTIKFLL